jgi:WD40 repeat protein
VAKVPSRNEATYAVAWSGDGQYLVTAGGVEEAIGRDSAATATVWDSETFTAIHELKGHTKSVLAAAFSPKGGHLATGGEDKTLRIWDTVTGQNLYAIRLDAAIHSLAWSPDGGRLASGDDAGCLIIWEPTAGGAMLSVCGHAGSVTSIAWSPDQRTLLTGSTDTTAKIWDTGSPSQQRADRGMR